MLAKKTSKNQVTIPKEIAEIFSGIEYFEVSVKDRKIVLMPVKITSAERSLEGIREKLEKLGVNREDVSSAVRWARGKARR